MEHTTPILGHCGECGIALEGGYIMIGNVKLCSPCAFKYAPQPSHPLPRPEILFPSKEEIETIICNYAGGTWINENTYKLLADEIDIKSLAKKIIQRIKELNGIKL
jgi:hypothetical protein